MQAAQKHTFDSLCDGRRAVKQVPGTTTALTIEFVDLYILCMADFSLFSYL